MSAVPDPEGSDAGESGPAAGARRIAALGAAAAVGSLLLVGSGAGEALLPVPDSYQFDPALTSPQFLRERVLPLLTLAGIVGHLAGLVALRRRDRVGAGRAWIGGWWATLAGLVAVALALAGSFFLGAPGLFGDSLVDVAFALGYLFGLLLAAVGVTVLGVGVFRRAADPVERAAGAAFALTPVAFVAWYAVDFGSLGWLVALPYPLGWTLLGYDLWRRPGADADANSGPGSGAG